VTALVVAGAMAAALAAQHPQAERVHFLPASSLRQGHPLYDDAVQHLDRVLAFVGDQTAAMPGKVVEVGHEGRLLTIKLDDETPEAKPGDLFTIHADRRFKGEFVTDTVEGCYLFGRVVRAQPDAKIVAGDQVDTRPSEVLDDAAAVLAERIDEALAALMRARQITWWHSFPAGAPEPAPRPRPKPRTRAAPNERPAKPEHALRASRQALCAASDETAARAALDAGEKALMALQRACPPTRGK
jgi:hypothetical protein